jgi:hypothetical protein
MYLPLATLDVCAESVCEHTRGLWITFRAIALLVSAVVALIVLFAVVAFTILSVWFILTSGLIHFLYYVLDNGSQRLAEALVARLGQVHTICVPIALVRCRSGCC